MSLWLLFSFCLRSEHAEGETGEEPGVPDRTAQTGYSGEERRKEAWKGGLSSVSEVLQDSASVLGPRQRRQEVQEDH